MNPGPLVELFIKINDLKQSKKKENGDQISLFCKPNHYCHCDTNLFTGVMVHNRFDTTSQQTIGLQIKIESKI